VRARLIDPLGPFFLRVFPSVAARSRDVDIALGAGVLSFRDGLVTRRVRARDIVAASTARTSTGVALSLVTRRRSKRPITLEVADDAEAREIRHALGIGHHGFGEIGLPTDALLASTVERVVRAITAFGTVGALLQIFTPPWSDDWLLRILSAMPLVMYATLPFLVLVLIELRRKWLGLGLVLSDGFVRVREGAGSRVVDYREIREVYADDRGLRLALKDGADVAIRARSARWSRDRPSLDEIQIAAAQIHSAVERTRGAGELAPYLPLRVADLAKTEDDAHAWLARLDATAASLAADGGYRGAAFDETDLWKTVDSADAPPELRAAAARVLVRAVGDRARAKLDEILPRVRVAEDERRIRIALDDDTERAAEAWTSFEKHERRRAG
jgi:hypothetical protein